MPFTSNYTSKIAFLFEIITEFTLVSAIIAAIWYSEPHTYPVLNEALETYNVESRIRLPAIPLSSYFLIFITSLLFFLDCLYLFWRAGLHSRLEISLYRICIGFILGTVCVAPPLENTKVAVIEFITSNGLISSQRPTSTQSSVTFSNLRHRLTPVSYLFALSTLLRVIISFWMRPTPGPATKRSSPPCCSVRTLILLEGVGFWLSLFGFDLRTWVFLSLLLISFQASLLAFGISVFSGALSLGALCAALSQFFHFFTDFSDPLLASLAFRVAPYPILFYLVSNSLIALLTCYTFPSICNFACPLLGCRCHWRPPCSGLESAGVNGKGRSRRSSDASEKAHSRSSSPSSSPLRIEISSSESQMASSSDVSSLNLASAGDDLECALLAMFRQSRAVLALVFLVVQLLLLLCPVCIALTLGAHPVRLMLVPMFAVAALLYLYLHLVVSRVGWRLAQRLSRAVRNFDALNGRQWSASAAGRKTSTATKALSLKCILSSSGRCHRITCS